MEHLDMNLLSLRCLQDLVGRNQWDSRSSESIAGGWAACVTGIEEVPEATGAVGSLRASM